VSLLRDEPDAGPLSLSLSGPGEGQLGTPHPSPFTQGQDPSPLLLPQSKNQYHMNQSMSAGTSSWEEEEGGRVGRAGRWPGGFVRMFGMGMPCVVELRRCVVCVCVCVCVCVFVYVCVCVCVTQ